MMVMKVAAMQPQIMAVLKARRTGNHVGIYSQLTAMPLTTLAGGGGATPPQPTAAPAGAQPEAAKVAQAASRRPSEIDKSRMKMGKSFEQLGEYDKIYVQTSGDLACVQSCKRTGWPGTYVVIPTDTNSSEMSKVKKMARESGIEPRKVSPWEEVG